MSGERRSPVVPYGLAASLIALGLGISYALHGNVGGLLLVVLGGLLLSFAIAILVVARVSRRGGPERHPVGRRVVIVGVVMGLVGLGAITWGIVRLVG